MATVSSPYGLKPFALIGSQWNNTSAIREYAMTANSATGIFNGDLVQISGGQPTAITATPTTASAGVVGICVGVRYVDPTMKYFLNAQFLPANAITNGYTQVFVKVYEDPDALFLVQATAAVTLASIGKNAQLSNFSAGNTTTGNSAVQLLQSSLATTATFAVRVIDLYQGPSGFSSPGDAFTDCIVKFNFGVHSYYNSTGA